MKVIPEDVVVVLSLVVVVSVTVVLLLAVDPVVVPTWTATDADTVDRVAAAVIPVIITRIPRAARKIIRQCFLTQFRKIRETFVIQVGSLGGGEECNIFTLLAGND